MKQLISVCLVVAGLVGLSRLGINGGGLAWASERPGSTAAVNPVPAVPANVTIAVNQVVASGFGTPVQVTAAGDSSGRLFVVEQTGRIKIIKNGQVLATPFLNLTGLVSCCGEQGLLGLAFHPQYKTNGYFYVNYTRASDGDTVIARYSVSPGNPDVADANSAVILLIVDQPYANHNGGQLLFGPDGYLYVGMGDGGSGGDPQNRAQDLNTLLGKMLRLDVNGGNLYAIPPDNPFVNKAGLDEIWALGLRNPWRFSFDRLTGDLYIGDVGQGAWEEVDYQAAGTPGGLNFGWRCKEGFHTYNFTGNCGSLSLVDPIAEYSHSEGNAITGGFVYRGSLYPALRERYFYADYGTGKIWSIYKTGPATWSAPELEITLGFAVSSFGEDEAGELYVVDYQNGRILRLADANGPSPDLSTSQKKGSSTSANPGEVVTYTILIKNSGGPAAQTVSLADTLPNGLAYVPGSLAATAGTVNDTQAPLLRWQGTLPAVTTITVTYRVTVTGVVTGSLINSAQLTSPSISPLTLAFALHVPRPVLATTLTDFFLPGTQPHRLTDDIPDPAGCDFCHTAPIYDRWRGSMMSQAGRDPLLWAALTRANNDAPGAGEYCLRCHTPRGWLNGRSSPDDGSALQPLDLSAGVACEVCHRLVDPVPSAGDQTVAIDAAIRSTLAPTFTLPSNYTGSAMMIVDPQDRRRGPFALTAPHSAFKTDFLGQSTNALAESRLCGTCHNVANPALSWDSGRGQFWPNDTNLAAPSFDNGQLFPIETTFDEWANSQYAKGGVVAPNLAGAKPGGLVSSCQDCHMRRVTGQAAEAIYNPVFRDCASTGCLPEHDLVGGNAWVPQILKDARWRLNSAGQAAYLDNTTQRARELLRLAATLNVTLEPNGNATRARVRVTNETGHKLPTGYPEGRRMWLNVRGFDLAGNLLYESGNYNFTTGVLSPEAKVYEAKQGLTPELAAYLHLPAGASFHFVLNNTVIKDNRIPPRGYTQAAFNKPGLRPVATTYSDGQNWDETLYELPGQVRRVVVVLYYQTASKEYIDFLRANGGLDGAALGMLWDTSPSPPEVMAIFDSQPMYFPTLFK